MINTRLSIFKTLQKKLKKASKHGDLDPAGFKNILYAVILNDMKEWSEYIPNMDSKKLVDILNRFLFEHKEFTLERFIADNDLYKNVNTPQDNTTWSRIWDIEDVKVLKKENVIGKKTFRINSDDENITFFGTIHPEVNGKELTMELHDQTLFQQ